MQPEKQHVTIISSHTPGMTAFLHPLTMMGRLWSSRSLLAQLVKKQLAARYRGSRLGLLWTLLNPLALLAVYTFVFSVVFSARWNGASGGGHGEYALALFSGLIAFNVFSETVLAAPEIITANRTYIRKMAFPVEVLPLATLGVALVQSVCSLIILLGGELLVYGEIPGTALCLPIMFLPLVLLSMGAGWFVAATGIFVRDTGHVLSIAVLMLFFVTPIFYPLDAVPEPYRGWVALNPMCQVVEGFRGLLLWGRLPGLMAYSACTGACLAVCLAGYAWFMKSKPAFADRI